MRRRRIWCETLPLARLREPGTIALLRRYGLEPIVAVRPDGRDELPAVLAACGEAGLRAAIWPMLADAEGRWCSAWNAGAYVAFARGVVDELSTRGAPLPAELFVDLEPPFEVTRRFVDGGPRAIGSPRGRAPAAGLRETGELLGGLVHHLRERGVATSAAVVPTALLGGRAGRGWQRLLGTPVSGIPWASASAMLYTSMIEGWSRGRLGRADALAILEAMSREAVARLGDRASVSLGAVGAGALGDEPAYRDPFELSEDVAAAHAAGASDLSLFDLGGVLARPRPEAWLEAFVTAALGGSGASAATAPLRGAASRAAWALGAARAAGALFDAAVRARRAAAPVLRSLGARGTRGAHGGS